MNEPWDAIVVGIGGMGGAALFHLAQRGLRTLGIDQYPPGHARGSSSGPSRGFRKASFADRAYVALANRAQTLWRALEKTSGQELLRFTAALFVAPPEHPALAGMVASAREYALPYEILDAHQIEARYPVLRPAPGHIAVLEIEAGVLFANRCNAAHVAGALARGARICVDEHVTDIESRASAIVVRTDRAEYLSRRVVITAGPWLPKVLERGPANVSVRRVELRVERQVELWFSPDRSQDFDSEVLPLFHFALPFRRSYYGIPRFDTKGVKVCRHYGGATVTADTIDRTVSKADEEDVRAFLRAHIPQANGELVRGKVCMNTNTPDMNFILGHHPADARIIVAGGFSGHGFKYAPVIGEIVADLATQGRTRHSIGLFSPTRFGR